MMRDPTATEPSPPLDCFDVRKARLEEADGLASQVREARRLLNSARIGGWEDADWVREGKRRWLMNNGPFSYLEAREALAEIERTAR